MAMRLDPAGFDAVIGEASEPCPVSRLFTGAKITVNARLERQSGPVHPHGAATIPVEHLLSGALRVPAEVPGRRAMG